MRKEARPVFTNRLLSRLRIADTNDESWWEIIFEETGSETIISSDKLPKHYDRFGTQNIFYLCTKIQGQTYTVGARGNSHQEMNQGQHSQKKSAPE